MWFDVNHLIRISATVPLFAFFVRRGNDGWKCRPFAFFALFLSPIPIYTLISGTQIIINLSIDLIKNLPFTPILFSHLPSSQQSSLYHFLIFSQTRLLIKRKIKPINIIQGFKVFLIDYYHPLLFWEGIFISWWFGTRSTSLFPFYIKKEWELLLSLIKRSRYSNSSA